MKNNNVVKTLITKEEIQKRVAELGTQISQEYAGEEVVLIGILKGAVVFLADLMRQIDVPVTIDFMNISSYGGSTVSSGEIKIIKDLDRSIAGKNVIVVEDIVDTGITLYHLLELLKKREPKTLKLAAFLSKPERREIEVPVDYIGFDIPNVFILGYGADFNEKHRELPYVGILQEN